MTVPEDRSLATLDTEKKSVEDEKLRLKSPELNGATKLQKIDNLPQQNTPDDIILQSSKESDISTVDKVSDSAVDVTAEKVNDDNEIDSPLVKRKRRRQALLKALYIILFNAAIPIGLYYALKPHIPAVWALVASTAPTIISVIAQAAIARRLDMIGVAVIFGFILSVILAVVSQDPKLLLLRESFVTAGVGGAMLVTLIPIRYRSFELKPILYYFAKDLIPMQPITRPNGQMEPRLEFFWRTSKKFRRHIRILTAIDVFTLECEFGLKLFYILHFDLDKTVVLSNITLTIVGIVASLCTIYYAFWIRKKVKQEEPELLAKDAISGA